MMSKEEQLIEAKKRVREAFVVFEHKEGSKMADAKEVPTIMRSLGINPTPAQLADLQEALAAAAPEDAPDSAYVALEHFEGPAAQFLVEQKASLERDDLHTLLRAFRALDPDDRGFIEAEQFRLVMTGGGGQGPGSEAAMGGDEVAAAIAYASDSSGRMHYEDYAYKLACDGRTI